MSAALTLNDGVRSSWNGHVPIHWLAGPLQLGLRADEVEHVDRLADALDRFVGVPGHDGAAYAANDSGTVSSSNTRMQYRSVIPAR